MAGVDGIFQSEQIKVIYCIQKKYSIMSREAIKPMSMFLKCGNQIIITIGTSVDIDFYPLPY